MLKRTEPLTHHGTGGNPAPDARTQIAQRLCTALNSGHLHRPGGRTCVEAGFAHALKYAGQVRAGHAQRQQVDSAGARAANQSGEERDLAAAAIRQRARNQAAEESDEREDADHQADILVRSAKIVTNVRRKLRQHRSDPQKSQKGGADKSPKLCAEAPRGKGHVSFQSDTNREL